MSRKKRVTFSDDQKRKAISEYVSGVKSAEQIASEMNTDVHSVYRWRTIYSEQDKGAKIVDLQSEGCPIDLAERILRMQEEIETYQKKVAQQSVIIDLLKKLQTSSHLPPESELSGLIATSKKLDQKKKRAK